MNIYETRKANARRLIEENGYRTMYGFAKDYGSSQSYISKILGGNPTKNIGEKVARNLEQFFNVPRGSLDLDNTQTLPKENTALTNGDKISACFDITCDTEDGWHFYPNVLTATISVWCKSWSGEAELRPIIFDTRCRALNALNFDPNRVAEARDAFLGWWQS